MYYRTQCEYFKLCLLNSSRYQLKTVQHNLNCTKKNTKKYRYLLLRRKLLINQINQTQKDISKAKLLSILDH